MRRLSAGVHSELGILGNMGDTRTVRDHEGSDAKLSESGHGESIWTSLGTTSIRIDYDFVGGWRTRILQAGDGDAIILLHGTGGHLEAYARNIEKLAVGHRVIAFDFPGHGYSDLATSDLEIPDYVRHLKHLMDRLGLPRATLCGESLGGWVAVKFAATYPHMVSRLILNTPGGMKADPKVMERIRTLSQNAADDPTRDQIRRRLEWLMADPDTVTDELVSVRRAIYSRPGFAESMRHILCLQYPELRARNLITAEEIEAVRAPTLVVWTSDDPSGPAADGMALAEALDNATYKLIEGAGHWPQWEQSEVYNAVVEEFMASHPQSGREAGS